MKCCGCGEDATKGGYVAVVKVGDRFVPLAVCDPCFINPAHRKVIIKGHFFPRSQAASASAQAGSSTGIKAE